jgi:hypothetical protein
MVAQVAALEPDTAANTAQPTTLVCSSRPGRLCIQGARPLNMSCESRVRNRISPIHTKSGSAVSVQLEAEPQMVTAMASPAGRDEKICMAIHATPESVRPIHTPLPRMRKSAAIRRPAMAMSLMAQRLRVAALAGRPRHSITNSSSDAMAKTMAPSAIDSCGIHSGVASLPVEMSW